MRCCRDFRSINAFWEDIHYLFCDSHRINAYCLSSLTVPVIITRYLQQLSDLISYFPPILIL